MRRPLIGTGLAAILLLSLTGPAYAHGGTRFDPIPGSAYGQLTDDRTTPFLVPDGYSQRRVADETDRDIYPGADDLTDMNTVNETGRRAGRYLYRTHEVGQGGSLSVVDLGTGRVEVLEQDPGYRRLDGLRWTPWGTLLFAEETTGGRLFEAFLHSKDRTRARRSDQGIAAVRSG